MSKALFRLRSLMLFVFVAPLTLGGCLLGAAVEVVGETVEAGVEITGAAAGAVVDIVTDDDDDEDDDD